MGVFFEDNREVDQTFTLAEVREIIKREEEPEERNDLKDVPFSVYARIPLVRFSRAWGLVEELQNYCRYLLGQLARSSGAYYLRDARESKMEYFRSIKELGAEIGKNDLLTRDNELLKAQVNELRHRLEHNSHKDEGEGSSGTGALIASPVDKDRKIRIAYYLANPEEIINHVVTLKEISELLNVGDRSVKDYLKEAEKQISKTTINGEEHFSWSKELKKLK